MEKKGSTRLYVISLGFIENDIALNLLLHNQADSDDKYKKAEWHRVPSVCLLIMHPELGNILIDTGSHPQAMEGYWPEETMKKLPLIRTKEDMLDARLGELGLTVNDIDHIILTHLHLDHAGGLCYFSGTHAGQSVIVHAEEIKQALYDTFIGKGELVNGYMRPDFYGLEGIHFDPLLESTELSQDLELLWLPGHTAGTLGVLVHLQNTGTVLYTSDSVNWEANIYPETQLSASFHDSLEMKNSINKIRWIQKRYNAKLIYGHDMNQFKKLKLSPSQYYD